MLASGPCIYLTDTQRGGIAAVAILYGFGAAWLFAIRRWSHARETLRLPPFSPRQRLGAGAIGVVVIGVLHFTVGIGWGWADAMIAGTLVALQIAVRTKGTPRAE